MGSKGALHSTFSDAQGEGWHKSEKQEAAKIPVTQLHVHLTAGAALLPSTLRDLEVRHLGAARREWTERERVPSMVLNSYNPDGWKATAEGWPELNAILGYMVNSRRASVQNENLSNKMKQNKKE